MIIQGVLSFTLSGVRGVCKPANLKIGYCLCDQSWAWLDVMMCDLHYAGAGGGHWTRAQAAWLRIMNTNIIIVIIAISLLPVNSCDWRHLTPGH